MSPKARWGRMQLAALAAVASMAIGMGDSADDPRDRLPNPTEEMRARRLFQQLRCVQCQNESIDASEAPIADDIRKIVRSQIAAGRSDKQVMDYLVQRYGQFILLNPPLNPGNLALWLTPLIAVLAGGTYLWIKSRQPAVEAQGLTEEEQRALEAIDAEDQDMLPPHSGLANVHGSVAIKH